MKPHMIKIALIASACLAVMAGGTLALQEKQKGGQKALGSGETATQPQTTEQKLDVSKVEIRALAGGLNSFFTRITPDASPGRNSLIISGLPSGTRAISVWMTEWASGNQPHAGGAFYYTTSVQLFNNGTQCRVIYNLDWNSHLPTACQVIYGPG